MANPPPRPPGYENKGWGGSLVTETGSIAGVPTSSTYIIDVRAGIVLPGGMPTVPGVNDPWTKIQDVPVRQRETVVADVDESLRQLNGATSVARASPPIPGLEAPHAAAVSRLEAAMRDLDQKRDAMNLTTDPLDFQIAKDQFRQAWQAVEVAYAQARATGN